MSKVGDLKHLKPIQRSRLRLYLGKRYFTLSRYLLWYFGGIKFARSRSVQRLPHLQYSHKTPLLRELKDVAMQWQYDKITNLKLAAAGINGIVIKPGETFSYWKLIGQPSAKRGYVPGMVLYGGSFHLGMGGGLCQLSNLIYWMTLHTPLTVIERYRHSYDVFPDSSRTQPFGSGATCVYPYRDLMIRNDTQASFQLYVNVGESDLEGAWLSDLPQQCRFKIEERSHCFKTEYWGGFSRHNELYRQLFTLEGALLEEEYIAENHALMMYSPFLTDDTEQSKGVHG